MDNIPFDYHLHTRFTDDASNTLEEMAAAAASRGVFEIAVTDHYLPGYPGYCVGPREIESHFNDASRILERHGVTVRIGLEADYVPEHISDMEELLRSFDFDIILGSAHIVAGHGMPDEHSATEYFEQFGHERGYLMYFDRLIECIESGYFDVMAHLDIVRKFGAAGAEPVFDLYREKAAAVADALARTNTGFELNCRGWDHAPAEPYPSASFLSLLRKRGITTVTTGSDAHTADIAGMYIDRGLQTLLDAGFTHISTFRRRKPRNIPIPSSFVRNE